MVSSRRELGMIQNKMILNAERWAWQFRELVTSCSFSSWRPAFETSRDPGRCEPCVVKEPGILFFFLYQHPTCLSEINNRSAVLTKRRNPDYKSWASFLRQNYYRFCRSWILEGNTGRWCVTAEITDSWSWPHPLLILSFLSFEDPT